MKAIIVLLFALALWHWWPLPASSAQPHPGLRQDAHVVLYATRWCGYCKKAREFFAANGIVYEERDIEASGSAEAEYRALGGSGVPVVVIDELVIHGFSPNRMLEALATP